MLLVPTSIRQSPIHGLGLFAEQDIPAGTILWRFEPLVDRVISEDELDRLPPHVAAYIEIYSEYFPELRVLVLSGDNDRYTNHADDPNTEVILPNAPEALVRARRDIAAGEEITCDYNVINCRAHPMVAHHVSILGEASAALV